MPLPITALYAAPLTALLILLSLRVIAARRRHGVSLGSGGHPLLERAMRAQANCAEYVPLGLLLLALQEGLGRPAWALHLLGLLLLVGRLAHGFGISREPEVLIWRGIGMLGTIAMLAGSAVSLLVLALRTLLA